MSAFAELLNLPQPDKQAHGLIHTPIEIYQQPQTWADTFRRFVEQRSELTEFLQSCGPRADLTVFLIGAGTSDYIGQALVHLLRKTWGCEVEAVASTDLLTNSDDWLLPGKSYLWVSFSRSGDSSEGVALLDLALEQYPQIRHLVISCNRDGRMSKNFSGFPHVFSLILADAVNDRGLAMTSSFTNMLIAGQCLAHVQQIAEYEQVLDTLTKLGTGLIDRAADLAAATAIDNYSLICFVGSGSLKAVARESALKVLELTAGRILTMSESFLGVRHGPLSALNDETLFVGFLSGDERRQKYELDLVSEISAKKVAKKIITIVPDNQLQQVNGAQLSLNLPVGFSDDHRPPLDVIFGQMLGLFASLHHELKPDSPSPNGAISRVVSQVNIY